MQENQFLQIFLGHEQGFEWDFYMYAFAWQIY